MRCLQDEAGTAGRQARPTDPASSRIILDKSWTRRRVSNLPLEVAPAPGLRADYCVLYPGATCAGIAFFLPLINLHLCLIRPRHSPCEITCIYWREPRSAFIHDHLSIDLSVFRLDFRLPIPVCRLLLCSTLSTGFFAVGIDVVGIDLARLSLPEFSLHASRWAGDDSTANSAISSRRSALESGRAHKSRTTNHTYLDLASCTSTSIIITPFTVCISTAKLVPAPSRSAPASASPPSHPNGQVKDSF